MSPGDRPARASRPARRGVVTIAHWGLALWSLLVVALLIWPAYDWLGNRFEPRVLGLPLAFAWNAILAVATFLVLGVYYLVTEPRGGEGTGREGGREGGER